MIFNGFLRFFGLLGRSWEALGALLRLLGASWERSWKLLARSWVSWVDHGGSWAVLGPSWGRLGTLLGASWGVDCVPAATTREGGGPGEGLGRGKPLPFGMRDVGRST